MRETSDVFIIHHRHCTNPSLYKHNNSILTRAVNNATILPSMETHTPKQKSGFMDMFIRAISVLGLIAVLLLGAWGIIRLAVNLPSIASSIGSSISSLFKGKTPTETLTVTLPTSATSGQTIEATWKHTKTGSEQYSYTLSYACQDGLTVKVPVPTGEYQEVACNTPFNYVNASEKMKLIPSLKDANVVPLILTASAVKLSAGAVTATGSTTSSIFTGSGTTATAKPATTTTKKTTTTAKTTTTKKSTAPVTYVASGRVSNPNGISDLAVFVTSTGIMDRTTGAFIPTNNIRQGNRVAVKFIIENVGTKTTPANWTFNVQLPLATPYTFTSQPQQALNPGDKIEYVLGFEDSNTNTTNCVPQYDPYGYSYTGCGYTTSVINTYGTRTITVVADTQNIVIETTKNNNAVSTQYSIY